MKVVYCGHAKLKIPTRGRNLGLAPTKWQPIFEYYLYCLFLIFSSL
uniref:Uncharacterized protein n=1 Tax=Rhizophora mucronata TaxID=61149 RepID=A0A2P2QVE4_RHIMU